MFKTGRLTNTLCAAAFAYAGASLQDSDAAATGIALPDHAAMTMGGETTIPIGHHEFCKKWEFAAECKVRTRNTAPMTMTPELWIEMDTVNRTVNRNVKPMEDIDFYGVPELWTYPDKNIGDCEDYALEKRRILLDLGWNESQLLMTVLKQANGEGHAVLTVRTGEGDFILDNLEEEILRWDEAAAFNGYTFVKRQSESHSGKWRDIRDGAPANVAAGVSVSSPSP